MRNKFESGTNHSFLLLKDRYFLCLIAIALSFTLYTVYMQSLITYVGAADDAQYALMSNNIVHGKGFHVNFILYHFVKYPSIYRVDDIASPLYIVLGALSITLFGFSAVSVKLVSILFGLIGIPILAYIFGKFLFSPKAGFIGAVVTIFNPYMYTSIIHNYADSLFAFLFIGTIVCVYLSLYNPRWLYLLGIVCGLLILSKGTGFLVVPILFGVVLFHHRTISKEILIGGILVLVVISPYIIHNFLSFGTPVNNISKYIVYTFNNDRAFQVYWTAEKPSFSWMLQEFGLHWWIQRIGIQLLSTLKNAFPIFLVLIASFFFPIWNRIKPLVFVFITYVLIHTVYWVFTFRYYMTFYALFSVVGAAIFLKLLESHRYRNILFCCLILFVISVPVFTISKYYIDINLASFTSAAPSFPFREAPAMVERIELSHWIDQNLPASAILMSSRVRDLALYSNRSMVQIPDTDRNIFFEVARWYNVTYIVRGGALDIHRKVDDFISSDPSFILIATIGNIRVYSIQNNSTATEFPNFHPS